MLFSKILTKRTGFTVQMPADSYSGRRAPFVPKRLAAAVFFACLTGATALVSLSADAAGLGRLTVQSGLGQALRAEIEVTSVSPEELQSLQVRMAPMDAFKQAGIDFNPALVGVRLSVDRQGARPVVKLSTAQPINEPFVDMLVELSWASGRLVREYTFLLDPPEMRLGRAPETVAPATTAAGSAAPVAAAPTTGASSGAVTAPTPAATASLAAGEVAVKRGDTLARIAARVKPQEATLEQALVALYNANPDAFAGNMNRMRAGAVLRVPSGADIGKTDAKDARRIVVAQTADFAAYRQRVASAVSTTTPASDASTRTVTGKIAPKVEDKAAVTPGSDQVKIARPTDGKTGSGKGGGATAADDLATKDKALAESRQRIAELERNVNELKALNATQSKAGAEVQKAAEARKPEETKAAPPAAAVPVPPPAPVAEAPKAEEPKPVPPAPEPVPTTPAKPAVAAPAPAPAPESSLLDTLFGNPLTLVGGASIVALLGGYALYSRNRKKRFEKFQDSILTGGDLKTNSIFGTTGGQSVDTADSTFNSNFTPSASQIDSNDVDPIAEADVYIAYGRDAQAEEILKEALKNSPDRHAIRVKLLEIYASRRDLPAFEAVAGELYSLTSGQGEDWDKAAELGRSLDPRNPLYGGSANATTATSTGVGALAIAGVAAVAASPLRDDGPATVPFDDPAATVPEVTRRVEEESVGVDFDLDLDTLAHAEPVAPPAPGFEAAPDAPLAKTALMDFDPGLSVSTAPAVDAGAEGTAPSLDFDLGDVEETAPAPMEFDSMQVVEGEADHTMAFSSDAASTPAVPTQDLGAGLDFDVETPATDAAGGLDFDIELPDDVIEAPVPAAVPAAVDLSSISLDLGGAALAPEVTSAESVGSTLDPAKHQEMATKLDLAAAYQEIGDREGAQELLEEVVRGGDAEQQARAQQMLAALT